ncbi:MAG TPA: hypothetical protein P5567_12350 [Kiritimatiellia bacterium]|nr:hypothetical protein [Kiritimatiellia bacterium]HRZ13232.1 hypothetical protein [Kiritimatiellia bacterium]HSA18681.1 hypothetical protein [Kiritimatiellia bacterium]
MTGRRIRPSTAIAAGIALLLVSWIVPGFWHARRQRAQAYARAGARALQQAAQHFYSDYGVWPVDQRVSVRDIHFGDARPNAEVLNALRGVAGPGNEDHAVNPHRTVYFDPLAAGPGRPGLDPGGGFVDPWGSPYHLVFDADLSGLCEVEDTIYGGQIGIGILVWSCGPDRRSDTPDDILTWTPSKSEPLEPL